MIILLGAPGSGKSTLAYTLLGHPKYQVTKGDILLDGESILKLKTDQRAKKGLFLGFQYPTEVSGVGFSHFLRTSYNALSKALKDEEEKRKHGMKGFPCVIAFLLDRNALAELAEDDKVVDEGSGEEGVLARVMHDDCVLPAKKNL
mgnify:CR=1 FL=1